MFIWKRPTNVKRVSIANDDPVVQMNGLKDTYQKSGEGEQSS